MLKIQHTEYPVGREPLHKPDANKIKEGGLWYCDKQAELVNEAKELVKPKRKDELKEFCIIFWQIVVVAVCLYIVVSKFLDK